jgi:hypothetical protein
VTVTFDAADVALVRSSFESALRDTPADGIPAVLAKLGWHELRETEPAVAVAELFEAQGRLLAATPALDLVVAAAVGADLPPDGAVVHPTLAAGDGPPGLAADEATVAVDGVVLAGIVRADTLLVPCREADGRLSLAGIAAASLESRAVAGFDESLRLVRVRGRVATGPRDVLERRWPEAAAASRRALAHELVGLAQAMLDAAGRHVTDRVQFGRPVATFQAVRHRLADLHVAIAAARSVLGTAWEDTDPIAAAAAKVLAGRAGLLAAQHCLQVTGAIGFTWEHGLHRQIRRVHLLDGLYGRAAALQGRIGAELLTRRAVPRLGVMGP